VAALLPSGFQEVTPYIPNISNGKTQSSTLLHCVPSNLKGDLIMSQTKGVKLDDTTQQRLAALGRIRDRSPHWLMCRAIETYLDREEKYEQEKREDMERWEQYQLTGVAVPHEQAAEWLENLAQGKVTACPG